MAHIRWTLLAPMLFVGSSLACTSVTQADYLPSQSSKANEQEQNPQPSAASITSSEEFDTAPVVHELIEGDGGAAREALSTLTAQQRVLVYRNLVDAFAKMPTDEILHHTVRTDLAQWLAYRLIVECRGERLNELFTRLLESIPREHVIDWFDISEVRPLVPVGVGRGIPLIMSVPDDIDLHEWIRKDPPDQAIRWHIRIRHEPNGSTNSSAIKIYAPPTYSFITSVPDAGDVLITLPADIGEGSPSNRLVVPHPPMLDAR